MIIKDSDFGKELVYEHNIQRLLECQNPAAAHLLDGFYNDTITEGQLEALRTYYRLQLLAVKTILKDLEKQA